MILLSNLVTSHVLLWGKCLPQGTTQTKVHSILQWRLELNLPRDVHARRYSTQLNPLLSVKNSQYWVKNGTAYKIVCYVSRSGIWYQTPHYVCNTQTVPIKKIISLRQYDIGSWWADTVVDPRYNQNKWLISNISIKEHTYNQYAHQSATNDAHKKNTLTDCKDVIGFMPRLFGVDTSHVHHAV